MRSTKFWVILLAAVFCAAAAGSYFVLRGGSGTTARIYSGGELIETVELSLVTEDYSFTVTGPNGGKNTVSVEPGRICVSEADCPDHVCVHQGWIENGVVPVVCLPNGLVIEISGDGGGIDGVSG